MDHEKYRNAFIANHSRLVRKLTSPELIETTFSKGMITPGEKEELEAERTDYLRINKFLGIFHRRYYGNNNVFMDLLAVLEDINENEGGMNDHVITALKDSLNNPPKFPSGLVPLSEFDRSCLQLNQDVIASTLDVLQLLPDLISEGVVTIQEAGIFQEEGSFAKRGQNLTRLLESKGSDIFKCFVEVLRDSEVYEQLANKLSKTDYDVLGDEKYVEKVLKDGRVPPLPQTYVRRNELIKTIRRQLRKLEEEDGWVVIHGLPGFGKTVLAADSVHQASLLRDVFPGGVFWLSVGRMRDISGGLDKEALLEKIQNFIVRMDENKYRPLNLESATDYLQTVMTEQHPRSLLILDDLWETESAQAFSVRCRTLATTRNIAIADSVVTNKVHKVSVLEGFTQEEGMALLSKHVSMATLPPEANDIIKLSYGSPIVLDIIGASLPKTSTSHGRWKVAVERLETQHPGGLAMRPGASPYLQARRPSEQKKGRNKATLNTSIALTEESLPEDPENIKEYFRWLVVFDEDTVIKPETLATIWDMNKFDAVDIMEKICSWSLVKYAQSTGEDDELQSYTVHDMILDYLKDTVPGEKQVEFHEQLVESYRDKCGSDFSSLEPDGYVHKKLLSHMHSAKSWNMLASLLMNLHWLAACVRYWDANSLLGAYKKYKTSLPEESLPVINEFQLFLSSNLDVLSTKPSLSDVVQLALTALDSDNLVKQAREHIAEDKDTMYLIWNNRLAAKRPEATLKHQPHKTEVNYCQYYDNGTKVVSCSPRTVKLWIVATGEILETFCSHNDQITHCAIAEDGSILITCSEDNFCNVWNVPQRKQLLSLKHFDGVQCCSLSHDNKTVVSVDISAHVMVWSCDTASMGDIIGQWDHEDSGLTSCVFTQSGKEVVIANQDGSIKLYSVKGLTLASYPITSSPNASISQNGISDSANSRPPSRSASRSYSDGGSSFTVRNCVMSKDGKYLAAAVGDCTARVWSVQPSELVHTFHHPFDVISVDLSPDSTLLVSGCLSGIIQVWSLIQRCPILDLPLHYDHVLCVKFSPTGSHILSSSFGGIIKVIPLETDTQTWKLYKRRFSVHFKMNMDREGYTPTIVCYDTKSKSLEVCQGAHATPVSVLDTKQDLKPRSWRLSPDGKLLVLGYDEGVLQLFEIASGSVCWTIDKAHSGEIPHCYFTPNGKMVVSCGEEHKVWLVENGEKISCQSNCQDYYVKPCVFYNDSIRLASAKKPGRILVWRMTDQKDLFYCDDISEDEEAAILCVNISGDNSRLVASTNRGTVVVWNAENGQKVFTGHYISSNSQARFCSLDFRGTLAAVGHDDCTLKIYDIVSGDEIVKSSNSLSNAWMISTQFSPDDKQILTLSNSIQWWSRDGKLLKQFVLKSIFGKYLYFSPDFKTFVTIDNTGLLYVLTVSK